MIDDKTNDMTTIPTHLQTFCIKGAIVTIDTMGCQQAIAETIVAQKEELIS